MIPDPTDTDTPASPVGPVTDDVADTPQGDTGGALPRRAAPVPVDDRDHYVIPRSEDDGADVNDTTAADAREDG